MLVATAGHIDHGKTALVRALTGVETDRLPEERARGITIDLGFAYWPAGDGRTIGFIDVPGHERFVRNMLAGVGGIDLALIVVAADDGVMPQTIEHVQILDLMGVSRALVAITKCDRASRAEIDAAREQIEALLAATKISGAFYEVSAVTNAGIDSLRAALLDAADADRQAARERHFRMAIDRIFSVTGAGTVITGTVIDGEIGTNDRLRIAPAGLDVRVRGLQSAGVTVKQASAGQRCAVNLSGVEVSQLHRGDWLVAAPADTATRRIEVRLRVLSTRESALKHLTPIHLHIGTADIEARVLIPRQAAIAPGKDAIVHLVLGTPTCAVTGDRFVVRDQGARTTIGGGSVIDPFVTGDRRGQSERAAISAALEQPSAVEAFAGLLQIPTHEIDTRHFERCFNLKTEAAQRIYASHDVILLGDAPPLALPAARVNSAEAEILERVKAFHAASPDASGLAARTLKRDLAEALSSEAFSALLARMHTQHRLVVAGSLVHLPDHVARLNAADQAMWQKLLRWLEELGAQPFTSAQLAAEVSAKETVIAAILHRKREQGEVWRIVGERHLLASQVAALASRAHQLSEQMGEAGFTAAQFRDAIGTGRTWAIHVLEFFDDIGVTRRKGDRRWVRAGYALVVGTADPYTP